MMREHPCEVVKKAIIIIIDAAGSFRKDSCDELEVYFSNVA